MIKLFEIFNLKVVFDVLSKPIELLRPYLLVLRDKVDIHLEPKLQAIVKVRHALNELVLNIIYFL